MADVTIFATTPDEALERIDAREVLTALRSALSLVTAEVPFTVAVHDLEEVED